MSKVFNHSTRDRKIGLYRSRSLKYNERAAELKKKHFKYSVARLFIFIISIAGMILVASYGVYYIFSVGFVCLAIFVFCLLTQFRLEKEIEYFSALHRINDNEVETILNHNNQYYNGQKYEDSKHFYSSDLDVYGPFSIYNLINRSRTYSGLDYLSKWLNNKPDREELYRRRQAIQELETVLDFRQEVAALLFSIEDQTQENPALAINKGFDCDFTFAGQSWLRIYRVIVPLLWIAGGTIYTFNLGLGYLILALIGLLNFSISVRYANRVSLIQNNISQSLKSLSRYAEVLESINKRDWDSEYLSTLCDHQSITEEQSNVRALLQLSNYIDRLDYRLHVIPSILLNLGLLWDTRMVDKIAIWKSQYPNLVDEVFEIIGKLEAISSLATWAFNYDYFCYGDITGSEFRLTGENMVHPLMDLDDAVPNNFKIDTAQYVSIITGSNMSGKSTMLRTIGLNSLLAYCGTRVAATKFEIPIIQLMTYMRIKDALEEDVSTFKAELNRVQMILDLIKTEDEILILIDEMLRGTNSKDKLRGSIAFVKQIITSRAHTLIATHDIQLTELVKQYPDHIKNYFFDISFRDQELEFDYKIKEGICNTFNASFLLEQMGLQIST